MAPIPRNRTAGAVEHFDIEVVRNSTDILDVVSEYVRLRPVGNGRYTGLCPFHQEKTPSFSVHQVRQRYKCFGCDAGGDVFKFLMGIEGLTFPQALKTLAGRAGVAPAGNWTPADHREHALAA